MYSQLQEVAESVKRNVSMSRLTSFKIGGPARYLVTVTSIAQLQDVLALAAEYDIQTFVLGGGSNLLVADEGFDGVVIQLKLTELTIADTVVIAQAGVKTVEIAQKSVAAGLTGFEWGVGVPGTIGGAVRGNSGASTGEMKDAVTSVTALIDGEIVDLGNAECAFGYRHSMFKENGGIVLSVTLTLVHGDKQESMKKLQEYLQYRMETQPKGYASTGCIFKNKEITDQEIIDLKGHDIPQQFLDSKKIPAGWLIEHSGLKGTHVGKASVSQAHGNFILNEKGASAAQVKELIEQIKTTVYTQYGISLEEEICLLGF